MTCPNRGVLAGMTRNRLPGRIFPGLLLLSLLLPPAPVTACDAGCSGTCSIALPASGTYLDPSYVASSPAVTTPTLVSLVTAGAPVALIDCRPADALAEPRIPGSMVFVVGWNHGNIAARFPGKDMLMILYDGGLVSVRGEARRLLSEAGFSNILQYPDGIRGWTEAGQTTIPTASDSFLGVPDIREMPSASGSFRPVSLR